MTNSLITVFNGNIANSTVQLCNACDLHSFLEIQTRFADWIKRQITDYGFVQDEDYIIVTERTNGRPRKEYHITLDMGKELAMVERNEKGRQIRKYFIECERRANSQKIQPNLPLEPVEPTYAEQLTAKEIHNLVWLWYSQVQMNELLGHLADPLDKIGSRFSPMVYSHHHEYKRQYQQTLPTLRRLVQHLRNDNPLEWERLHFRLDQIKG